MAGGWAEEAHEGDLSLDLLYTFCQLELRREQPDRPHLRLYLGIDGLSDHEQVARLGPQRYVVLLNSLSSFSSERERAEEFGSHIMEALVPRAKVFFHNKLIPRFLTGEDEYVFDRRSVRGPSVALSIGATAASGWPIKYVARAPPRSGSEPTSQTKLSSGSVATSDFSSELSGHNRRQHVCALQHVIVQQEQEQTAQRKRVAELCSPSAPALE